MVLNESPQTDFIIKEIEQVRAEIVSKMQACERVTMAELGGPAILLPVIAKVVTDAAQHLGHLSPFYSFIDVALAMVCVSVPFLLAWAELFCAYQTNGVARAGHWIRTVEAGFGLGDQRQAVCGWETWLEKPGIRSTDDKVAHSLRRLLFLVFYVAAALLVVPIVESIVSRNRWPNLLPWIAGAYLLLLTMTLWVSLTMKYRASDVEQQAVSKTGQTSSASSKGIGSQLL